MFFYGSSAKHLRQDGHKVETSQLSDGEISTWIRQDVENKKIVYIQSTCYPVNDNLLELLITVNAFKQKFVEKITVVIPYFGYSRQDRLDTRSSAISAKVVADSIGKSGIDKLIVIDLHTPQLAGFFPIPVLHISALSLFSKFIKENYDLDNLVICSPDIGGLKQANELAESLGVDVAIIDKKRYAPGDSEPGYIVGNVQGKVCILIDDMIDTGNTLIKAANKLTASGATQVDCMATHALLNGKARENLQASRLQKIYVTNTINQQELPSKFVTFDIRDLLSSLIR